MEQTAINNQQKFFLYARKSTDVEDKQMRSIPDQLLELREFAKREGINIVEEFTEAKTAKVPGRAVFNTMVERLEKDEASGILAWHPDRLARNSVDGGKIIYLVDLGKIKYLKFPQFWFEATPQGKFMLSMAFVQSKYFVDSLSENTKRGLRQKVKRGEMPGLAPIGYKNILTADRRKIIVVDKKKSPFIKEVFEKFSTGKFTLKEMYGFLAKNGITTSGGKPLKDKISWILSNTFYYGHFKFKGEIHEGVHSPIITKKLWDLVQVALHQRSKPWSKANIERIPKPYLGLFRCGECGMMITGETKTKLIKSTNQYATYMYYRCTKKSKSKSCSQAFIRQEELDRQLSNEIATVSLRQDWVDKMLLRLSLEEKDVAQSCHAFVGEKQSEIKAINEKLQRLLDSYLEQDIERDIYLTKKSELLSQKKKLEEQVLKFQQTQNAWLEPMKQWIMEAAAAANIARNNNLEEKKVLALKIFGSNLKLTDKIVYSEALNQWSALRADPPTRDWERGTRIGLASPPWEGSILPVY